MNSYSVFWALQNANDKTILVFFLLPILALGTIGLVIHLKELYKMTKLWLAMKKNKNSP